MKTLNVFPSLPVLPYTACRNAPFLAQAQQNPSPDNRSRYLQCKRMSSVAAPSQNPPASCSSPTFSYRIGASFSAKGRRFDPKKDVFTFNPKTQPTSEHEIFTGRPNSGQDAFFVSRAGNSNNVAFGVADGVGGWADQGIDSAHFSHGLCRRMATVARELHAPDMKDLRPQFILGNAYQEIIREGKINGGGSTVCLATGHEEGNVKVAK